MRSFLKSWQFILLFLIFILATYALALWLKLYYVFWWLDIAHHLLGGFWVACLANFYFKKSGVIASGATLFFMVLGIVALIGVLWEFVEFASDSYVWNVGFLSYEDTLSDLFFDLLGGAFGLLLIL